MSIKAKLKDAIIKRTMVDYHGVELHINNLTRADFLEIINSKNDNESLQIIINNVCDVSGQPIFATVAEMDDCLSLEAAAELIDIVIDVNMPKKK